MQSFVCWDSAIGLLKASGIFKNSAEGSLDPIILSTTSSYRDLCEYIQNAWEEIGIPVQIDVLPAAVFREDKSNGRLPVYRASWIADYPDSENYLMLFESKMSAPHQGSIKRQFQKGLWFRIANSPKKREFHVKINRIQIDNQMVCYRIFPRNMYNN